MGEIRCSVSLLASIALRPVTRSHQYRRASSSSKLAEYFSEMLTQLPVQRLPPTATLRDKYHVIFAVPRRMPQTFKFVHLASSFHVFGGSRFEVFTIDNQNTSNFYCPPAKTQVYPHFQMVVCMEELCSAELSDMRRNRRFVDLSDRLPRSPHCSFPQALTDAVLKAAYHFFDNPAIDTDRIIPGARGLCGVRT